MLQNGETTCTTCTVPGIMYYLAMQRSGVCVHTTVYVLPVHHCINDNLLRIIRHDLKHKYK